MRRFSFLTDPANFGTLMSTGALGAIIFSQGPFTRTKKMMLGFFSLVILMGMSYSGTRTAYLTLTAGLFLYILMTIYERRTRIVAFCAAAVLALVLFLPIYGNVTINRIRSAFQPPSGDASYDLRNVHRHELQPFLHSHPFGNGVNTTMGAGKEYNPDNFLAGFPPDSSYFQIALEQGWVGLVLNCIFYFTILFYSVHYFYKCRNKEIKIYYGALTAMLFSMMLGAYTQFTISSIPQNFVFIALVACVIKLHTYEKAELRK
jgi:O-antigen ligase